MTLEKKHLRVVLKPSFVNQLTTKLRYHCDVFTIDNASLDEKETDTFVADAFSGTHGWLL